MNFIFRMMMGFMVALYRLSNGKVIGRMAGLNLLLLTTTGRKTGKQHTTELGCFEQDGDYVIIASNGGADNHPKWFLNLKKNPQVSLQIQDKKVAAVAEEADPKTREVLWAKLVSLSPQYGKYATSTKRVIPMIRLHPQT